MDTNQPVMVCPTNLIVKACDTNPVVVNWTLGAALTCGNLAGIASSPPSGTAFLPDTTNTITAWAWTQCLVTNSCTFTVAVARALLDLTMTYSAGNITLHWADGVLQQASVVTGPYADVPLASPPAYTIPANQIQSFYRLRCGTPVRQVTINNGPGDQTDPHVSGDLVVYADATSLSIRYYSFLTRADTSVPQSPTDVDTLPDISGTRIAFSRAYFDRRACMVYDIMANTLTEIAPQAGTLRFDTALAGNTVAFVEQTVGNGEIMVYDLATQGPLINASLSPEIDLNPRLAPLGDVVVWDRCNSSYSDCRIMKSVRTGGVWGPATIVSGPSGVASDEGSPDTDGTWVVYQSIRPSATGPDIYFRPLAGGPETQLAIPGSQYYPSIKSGVIAFQSVAPAFGSASDIYVYIIAKSMLIQVTNTFLVNEVLNDIDVLPNGDIRVVWAADDGPFNEYNVYALTFTPP
jgi:hypothetical protein